MEQYYRKKLSARRLENAYQPASPRIRQYLHTEVGLVTNLAALMGKCDISSQIVEVDC